MNPLTNYVRLGPHILLEKFYKFLSKVHMVQMVRFFTLKYYQQILITGNTGWPVLHLDKLNQFVSNTDMVRFLLHLQKFSVKLYQDTIPFEQSCPLKDSQYGSIKSSFLYPW